MVVLDGLGIVAAVLLLLVAAVAVRRRLLGRAGATLDVSLRLRRGTHGRGWALGAARYRADELQWYRTFSLAPRPSRVLARQGVTVRARRVPAVPESLMLQAGSVVLECTGTDGPFEIAMTEGGLTGFLSWVEAGPGTGMPSGAGGVSSRRLAARARRRRGSPRARG